MKLDWDLAQKVMELSFKYYFEGRDEKELVDSINKAKVVGYTRLLRRTLKREKDNGI